ncbi:hypothetical protein BHF71_10020 [Vulcanibacillus modesticaldus]|uniref:Uncharacterized protein n=1 Tax=Vulcanibacillus modesticaldus TaxID=337097 RepID=A0A1D2YU29_9BACI|nr:hypothetical protein [Vulcanibacillus modesticaldus]OEF99161.1 hypothetical protein BHF71_10020 [Vulcanibacillus modesticaldus]
MPSFRYKNTKRDREIKEFLEKQKDKSECIRNALYQYIYPEENEKIKSYITRIRDLEAQIKMMQKTILLLSKQTSATPIQEENFIHDDELAFEEDINISDDFKVEENEEIDHNLFSTKMKKNFGGLKNID